MNPSALPDTDPDPDRAPGPGPTALLYGADSPVVTARGAAEAARLLPSAVLSEIPRAGHMLFWDNPPAALAALRQVLRPMLT